MHHDEKTQTANSAGAGNVHFTRAMRRGFIVFGLLAVIETVEFAVGLGLKRGAWVYLAPLAIAGAWPIFQYFMHIADLWRPKE